VTTVTASRWQLVSEPPEEARCFLCGEGERLVDLALEREGERLYVCVDDITALARTARVGSRAAEALRAEYEAELRERDQQLGALAGQLAEKDAALEAKDAALNEVRDARERDVQLTRQIQALASQLRG
jgi:hypothetical protein